MGKYANFYNSVNGDRTYDAESFSEWLKPFFRNGVFNGELQVVQNTGMNITVKKGNAYINGKLKNFEEDTQLRLETAHATLSRIDNIIVRRDDTTRDFSIMVVKGNFSQNPQAPILQRVNGVYDIVLAQILVKPSAIEIKTQDITDTRVNTDLCGWVTGTVEQIDFSQISSQWQAYIEDYKNRNQNDFDNWFKLIQNKLSTDQAGNLQNQINDINHRMKEVAKHIVIKPNEWIGGVYTLIDPLITSANSYQEFCDIEYDPLKEEMFKALARAGFKTKSQTVGKTEIICTGVIPKIDVEMVVIFRGER